MLSSSPPPPPVFPHAATETESHLAEFGLGTKVAHDVTTTAVDPLTTLLSSLSSPSTSTISLPSTSTLSWDELTLGTPSPLRTSFLPLPPAPEEPRVKDEQFKSNPFGFSEEMVKGEVRTTGSIEVGDREERRRVEEERRRGVWKEIVEGQRRGGLEGEGKGGAVRRRSFAEVAKGERETTTTDVAVD